MIDHRVATIWFWEAVIACLILSYWRSDLALWVFSSFAVVPLGLFMPILALTCAFCSSINASYQVDLSGYTNAACSTCAIYNSSFVLVPTGVPGDVGCAFIKTISSSFCFVSGFPGFNADDVVLVFGNAGGGNTRAQVYVGESTTGQTLTLWQSTLGATPYNCSGLSSTAITRVSHGAFTCAHDGSAAQVTAL